MLITLPELSTTHLSYVQQLSKGSRFIYMLTLGSITTLILALPFVKLPVSVKGQGYLTSEMEKVDLVLPVTGQLKKINIRDNQKVKKNEVLLEIDSKMDQQQWRFLHQTLGHIRLQLSDLTSLLVPDKIPILQTKLYKANWEDFLQKRKLVQAVLFSAKKNLARFEQLHRQKVVSDAEFEQYVFNYKKSVDEDSALAKSFHRQCELERHQLQQLQAELLNQRATLETKLNQYRLVAPLNGSVQGLKGLQIGSYISANQKIGEISPDRKILAICYLNPKDIGLIKLRQQVKLQLEAFDYRHWGMIDGWVADISDDVTIISNTPFYKIKCQINKHDLSLKTGYIAHIKKGMIFTACFIVTTRNAFQLLFDSISDWLIVKS